MSLHRALVTPKARVQQAFARAAEQYDAAAILQREVHDRMFARLDYIQLKPQQVIDLGCGTGYGLPQLGNRYPDAQILGLDMALDMLRYARGQRPSRWQQWWQKLSASSAQRQYLCADIEKLPLANACVDLLWSNLALQWCQDLDATFTEMQRVLAPQGLIMFSTLGPDTLREIRQAFAGVDGYTHVNHFVDMHDLGDALVRHGFENPVMDMEFITLTYDNVPAVFRDLKQIGAYNHTEGRAKGLMGKHTWQQVVHNYEQLRRADGRLPLTYEVIYGHAWQASPATTTSTRTDDGRQVINFYPRAR